MSLIKKIIGIILILNYSITFANNICNMNGDWFDPVGPGRWHFQQDYANFKGTIKAPPPSCGAVLSGEVHPENISFIIYPTKIDPGCNFLIEVKAEFIPDCLSIQGHWTTLINGKETESGSILLFRNPIKIIGPEENPLVITSEPKMPNLQVKAVVDGPLLTKFKMWDIPPYMWNMKFTNIFIPNKSFTLLAINIRADESVYQPDFNSFYIYDNKKPSEPPRLLEGSIIGGELTLSVDYYQNVHDEKQITILGTNPGQDAIEKMITDKTLRQIACQESRYRQFNAKREGGVGYPIGTVCGVGIMQLCNPAATPEQTWDWRENIKGGMKLYEEKYFLAHVLANIALIDMNKRRVEAGLPKCTTLPPRLNEEQMQRDIIRQYNCGHEYQWKPWDDPDCKGQWVEDPECRTTHPTVYDAEYIDRILACDINH